MPQKETQNLSAAPAPLFRWSCVVTVFLGAWLLFQVQPLISKAILPWFGGAPAVWTTCMLFFQCLLLAGYAVAHLLARRASFKVELVVLLLLAAAAVVTLPILPDASWKPIAGAEPIGRILALLAFTIGPAYLLLSTTSPLGQVWWSRASSAASPYRLYALSNAGSLLALLSYPFLIEPWLGVAQQALWWSVLFVFYAIFLITCQVASWKSKREKGDSPRAPELKKSQSKTKAPKKPRKKNHASKKSSAESPSIMAPTPVSDSVSWINPVLWIGLSACGSVLLLATTNAICQDVAVEPMLWIAPLSLYLLTFIIAFDSPRWYVRGLFGGLAAFFLLALLAAALESSVLSWSESVGARGMLESLKPYAPKHQNLISFATFSLLAFFSACMVCHGELYRLRPPASRLTSFYLCVATGGALGGVLVGVLAPMLLNDYYEMPAVITAFWLLFLAAVMRDPKSRIYFRRAPRACLAIACLTLVPITFGWAYATAVPYHVLEMRRNFYGVLEISQRNDLYPEWEYRELTHGSTIHGTQFLAEDKRHEPTSYYSRNSGVGLAMKQTEQVPNRSVGLVGLGAGTLATYGLSGDEFRFYEINPDVEQLTREYFTYLQDSQANCEVLLGDARLSLSQSDPQGFSLLVLDAFSSDAIPIHLLTQEAFSEYLRHLSPEGIIAVHISNRHLDLEPVLVSVAEKFGFSAVLVDSKKETQEVEFEDEFADLADPDPDTYIKEFELNSSATWILLSRDPAIESLLSQPGARRLRGDGLRKIWTDDNSNIFEVLGK